jgi:hypothetical protein
MAERYQSFAAVADGAEAATAVRAALDALRATLPAGAVAVSELRSDAIVAPVAALELGRIQRAIADGAAARRWRHSMNNSLAAIMAEAQLLEMERLTTSQLDGVGRIVAICRATVAGLRRDVQDAAAESDSSEPEATEP